MSDPYPGLVRPDVSFNRLIKFRAQVAELRNRCQPGTADRAALNGVLAALDRAGRHFTGAAEFWRPQGHSTSASGVPTSGGDPHAVDAD